MKKKTVRIESAEYARAVTFDAVLRCIGHAAENACSRVEMVTELTPGTISKLRSLGYEVGTVTNDEFLTAARGSTTSPVISW